MTPEDSTIALIRLARSPIRIMAVPAILLLAAGTLVAMVLLGPLRTGEAAWYLGLAGAAVLTLLSLALVVRLATMRLEIEESIVRFRWLGGARLHPLAAGPVTRVRLRGESASRLRARSRWLGWDLGRARLRDEEDIEVVRLAPTPTVILVPTERGRLAIAPTSEDELIEALSRAARARQRLEEAATAAASVEVAEPAVEPEPPVLTGIERALLAERLERERQQAELAAAAAAEELAREPEPEPASEPQVESASEPRPTRGRRGWRANGGIARATARVGRPRPSAAFVLVPLVGAGIVWGAAVALGRLPDPTSDLGRLTSLALVLAGPATSVGAIMARAWWPRMVGVVVTSGLVASVFVGRAIFGT